MTENPNSPIPTSRSVAWRNAFAITFLGCLMGLFGFVFLGRYLPERLDLFWAAVVQYLAFACCLGLIQAVIVIWQRSRGSSLRELGWLAPTTRSALVAAIVMGILYLAMCWAGAKQILRGVDVTAFSWTRLALVPVGIFMATAEETMMRGFFMNELHKARVAVWLQIVASGACSALYHGLHDLTWMSFVPSFVLFSIQAGLYVAGNRSLTAPIVAHSMYNVFGEPYLLMMALAVMPK